MIDTDFPYIIIAASLCCGIVVGYFLRGFFRTIRSESKRGSGMPMNAGDIKNESQNQNHKKVAQLWFDSGDRKFILQVGEKYFKRADDLSPNDRVKLSRVVSGFYHWLEPVKNFRYKEAGHSQLNQSGNHTISTPAEMMTREDEKFSDMDSSARNQQKQAFVPEVSPSAPFSQSMVSQVDAILQEKIHIAGMEKWAIRLTEFPQRGMVIMVGLEQYDSIDQVPYEQARNIIRKSISEWEQRADQGR